VFAPRRLGLFWGKKYVSKEFLLVFVGDERGGKRNVRKADSQVRAAHAVASFVLDDAVEVQDERT